MKNNNQGKPSTRTQFELYRDQKVKGKAEQFILSPSQRARANYLWSNKTSNLYKIKAMIKKESSKR